MAKSTPQAGTTEAVNSAAIVDQATTSPVQQASEQNAPAGPLGSMEMTPVTAAKMPLAEWARSAGISLAGQAALRLVTKPSDRFTAGEWMERYQEQLQRHV